MESLPTYGVDNGCPSSGRRKRSQKEFYLGGVGGRLDSASKCCSFFVHSWPWFLDAGRERGLLGARPRACVVILAGLLNAVHGLRRRKGIHSVVGVLYILQILKGLSLLTGFL